MSKKFTIKAHRLRARARIRNQSLKVEPQVKGKKTTLQEENHDVIKALAAKL